MTMLVADTFVETAVRAGVERVCGVIGDSLNPIGEAMRRNGWLRWAHVRHEGVAAFASGAEAQLTGQRHDARRTGGTRSPSSDQRTVWRHRTRAPVFALASVIASAETGRSSS